MVRAGPSTEGAKEREARAVKGYEGARKEKLELSELKKLEALKKAMEDASGLRDIILERQSMIDSLRSRVEEKIELRGKVQQLSRAYNVASMRLRICKRKWCN